MSSPCARTRRPGTAGASGTVVDILNGGEALNVDIVDPFDAVVTVTASDLDVIVYYG
jgi:hypothetical protein